MNYCTVKFNNPYFPLSDQTLIQILATKLPKILMKNELFVCAT